MLEILLGQVPEAMFFALFMIFVKEYKEKRVLFIISMIIEYVLLLNVFPYSIWSHVLYFIISFILMKILYKTKCNVTDVFTLSFASIIMILISAIIYFPMSLVTTNTIIGNIIQKIGLFLFLLYAKNKLPNIHKMYQIFWNRNNKPKKMKSTTFRALLLLIFNISFYIINIGMVTTILLRR